MHLVEHGNMTVELKDRFVQTPAARSAFLAARRSVLPHDPESDHEAQWSYIQECKPFDIDLTLSPERLHYMQAVNVSFGVQDVILPFHQVADMSLATDALKLLGPAQD